eukprot:15177311-Ditylum_brightwellii.AAC.1
MLNSAVYEVEFPDSKVKKYAAIVIAKNMLTQVNFEGFATTMMEGIIDHDRNQRTAVHMKDKHVLWKDNSEWWVHLEDMKESHLIKVAEYARAPSH